jgi:hypothetical protein
LLSIILKYFIRKIGVSFLIALKKRFSPFKWHFLTLLAEYPFHGGGKGYSAEIVYYSIWACATVEHAQPSLFNISLLCFVIYAGRLRWTLTMNKENFSKCTPIKKGKCHRTADKDYVCLCCGTILVGIRCTYNLTTCDGVLDKFVSVVQVLFSQNWLPN